MQGQDAWHVLYVEDDDDLREQVKRYFDPKLGSDQTPFLLEAVSSFDEALIEIERRRYDLLILDVFAGEPGLDRERAGVDILSHLKRVRFVPTIFYTALPLSVEELKSPFVAVISKEGSSLSMLLDAANSFIDSGLLALNRGLLCHVENILLDYMEGFVVLHWSTFANLADKRALAYLVARRLAMSLASTRIDELAQYLGEVPPPTSETEAEEERVLVHRMQYYIMPPVSKDFLTGDIFEGTVNERTGHWVILTPSCDMVTDRGPAKAEFVHLAFCSPLNSFPEYRAWQGQPDDRNKRGDLEALMRNNRRVKGGQPERYHYLPGVFQLPHLVVDFQQVHYLHFTELQTLSSRRIASLDSPYAEALLGRYNRFNARFGTPDLNTIEAIEHLTR